MEPTSPTTPDSAPSLNQTPRTRWRELIGSALFESIFVVLGVVLAYAANEWRETRLHRAEAASAKHAIANELRANRELASTSRTYHQQLMGALWQRDPKGPPPSPGDFRGGFINPAQLSMTAWEVASETGVLQHMPYTEVLAVSQAYALQRRYDAMALSSGQLMYGELYRAGPNGIAANYRNLASIIAAFSYREELLIRKIDSTLAILDSKPAAPTAAR